jgi:hypothetical protein
MQTQCRTITMRATQAGDSDPQHDDADGIQHCFRKCGLWRLPSSVREEGQCCGGSALCVPCPMHRVSSVGTVCPFAGPSVAHRRGRRRPDDPSVVRVAWLVEHCGCCRRTLRVLERVLRRCDRRVKCRLCLQRGSIDGRTVDGRRCIGGCPILRMWRLGHLRRGLLLTILPVRRHQLIRKSRWCHRWGGGCCRRGGLWCPPLRSFVACSDPARTIRCVFSHVAVGDSKRAFILDSFSASSRTMAGRSRAAPSPPST